MFYSEFDIVIGAVLTCQTPTNYITNNTFKVLQSYVIPNKDLCGKLMVLSLGELALLGLPVEIINPKYARGSYAFNFGLIMP